MKRIWIITSLFTATYAMAHSPTDATAKELDTYTEIKVFHASDDPNHYVKHVTIKRDGITYIDKTFDAQTDNRSLDIQITHPRARRKRIKRGMTILVEATCSRQGTLSKQVKVD